MLEQQHGSSEARRDPLPGARQAQTYHPSSDGGELCSARCAEQPFDVAFHPGNNGIFVSGLITGAVSTRRRRLRPIFRDVAAVSLVNPH